MYEVVKFVDGSLACDSYLNKVGTNVSKPCANRRGKARPGEARPGEARPGEARPGEARPGVARPGEARPGEARPGEPAQVKHLSGSPL